MAAPYDPFSEFGSGTSDFRNMTLYDSLWLTTTPRQSFRCADDFLGAFVWKCSCFILFVEMRKVPRFRAFLFSVVFHCFCHSRIWNGRVWNHDIIVVAGGGWEQSFRWYGWWERWYDVWALAGNLVIWLMVHWDPHWLVLMHACSERTILFFLGRCDSRIYISQFLIPLIRNTHSGRSGSFLIRKLLIGILRILSWLLVRLRNFNCWFGICNQNLSARDVQFCVEKLAVLLLLLCVDDKIMVISVLNQATALLLLVSGRLHSLPVTYFSISLSVFSRPGHRRFRGETVLWALLDNFDGRLMRFESRWPFEGLLGIISWLLQLIIELLYKLLISLLVLKARLHIRMFSHRRYRRNTTADFWAEWETLVVARHLRFSAIKTFSIPCVSSWVAVFIKFVVDFPHLLSLCPTTPKLTVELIWISTLAHCQYGIMMAIILIIQIKTRYQILWSPLRDQTSSSWIEFAAAAIGIVPSALSSALAELWHAGAPFCYSLVLENGTSDVERLFDFGNMIGLLLLLDLFNGWNSIKLSALHNLPIFWQRLLILLDGWIRLHLYLVWHLLHLSFILHTFLKFELLTYLIWNVAYILVRIVLYVQCSEITVLAVIFSVWVFRCEVSATYVFALEVGVCVVRHAVLGAQEVQVPRWSSVLAYVVISFQLAGQTRRFHCAIYSAFIIDVRNLHILHRLRLSLIDSLARLQSSGFDLIQLISLWVIKGPGIIKRILMEFASPSSRFWRYFIFLGELRLLFFIFFGWRTFHLVSAFRWWCLLRGTHQVRLVVLCRSRLLQALLLRRWTVIFLGCFKSRLMHWLLGFSLFQHLRYHWSFHLR